MGLLAAPTVASEFASPTYNQANDLAAGRSTPGAVYDGSDAGVVLQGRVNGALNQGGLTVPAVPPPSERSMTSSAAALAGVTPRVPSPATSKPFFSGRSLGFAAGGAAVGAGIGWLAGGPLGALIGAAVGLALGFLLSKILK